MPRQTVTESKLTSPFLMEDLLHGVKALKNNKAAGLDDMLCEQIKHFGEATLRWLLHFCFSHNSASLLLCSVVERFVGYRYTYQGRDVDALSMFPSMFIR